MKKIFFLLCFSSSVSQNLFSQLLGPPSNLPVIIQPSPQSRDFLKYGEYPVDFSTGLPEISIPIYNVKSGSLSLPINISYHSSGLKPRELSGVIGSGWSLNAGGRVTRVIYGAADDVKQFISPNKNAADINYNLPSDFDLLSQSSSGVRDSEYDIFSFGTTSGNGRFFLKDNNGTKQPVTIPFKPVNVTFNTFVPNGTGIKYFNILEEDGTLYRYGTSLITNIDNLETTNTHGFAPGGGPPPFNNVRTANSSWLLSEIISANKTDTIQLKYVTFGAMSRQDIAYFFTVEDQFLPINNCGCSPEYNASGAVRTSYSSPATINDVTPQYISEIIFRGGKLTFDYYAIGGPGLGRQLQRIRLYNTNGTLLKTFQFQQSYFSATNVSKYKLDALNIQDNQSNLVEPYKFYYWNTGFVEDNLNSMSVDYWGYSNGSANSDLYPSWWRYGTSVNSIENQIIGYGTADREVNEPKMMAGQLKTIEYPTGGKTDFSFESNKTLYLNAVKDIGGLRIKKIENFINGQLVNTKTYKYGLNENGTGTLHTSPYFMPNFYYQGASATYCNMQTISGCVKMPAYQYQRKRTYSPFFINELGFFSFSPMSYEIVTEYSGGAEGELLPNSGKTVYKFSQIFTGAGSGQLYGLGYDYFPFRSYAQYCLAFDNLNLLNKKIFKKEGSVYNLVTEETNQYQNYPVQIEHGLKIFRSLEIGGYMASGFEKDEANAFAYPVQYSYGDIVYDNSVQKLVNKKTIAYSDGGSNLIQSSDYIYGNPQHFYPTEVKTDKSDGNTTITRYKYPQDLTGTIPSALVLKNMLNEPLEEKIYKSVSGIETLLATKQNEYIQSGSLLQKKSIKFSTGSSTPESRLLFNSYDSRENIIEMQKNSDFIQSYIWDYNKYYPIAEVTNAAQADIAYTSFEADGSGNWSFSGVPVACASIPTGSMVYNLSSGNITKSVLASSTYAVSYWRPAGLPALIIAGTIAGYPITGRTANGWTYYEHQVTGQTVVTLSGTGFIDEVRLYPYQAQMTTYTYKPLIGMTTQCDVNNRITYYEYDAFSRLVLVRDQDKNIIKKICYNYSGQPENCNYYYNAAKSGTFTRNNCGSGFTGSTVTYTVQANTYSSAISQADADALAQADVNANGQNYANTNGTCINSCSFTMNAGYTSPSNGISNNGTTVSFYIVFYRNITMSAGNRYTIATINGPCRPSQTRTINYTSAGRSWTITIFPTGQMEWLLIPGSPSVPANTTISTTTLTYNL